MTKLIITQEEANELFYYLDGFLYRKTTTGGMIAGSVVGGIAKRQKGDRHLMKVKGVTTVTSRIIFLIHHGWLPEVVDHEYRNPLNNKIENLRAATQGKNCANKTSRKNSSSKYLGVSFHKQHQKWVANICVNYKNKHIGIFNSEKEAALAYNKQAVRIHGEFANLNIILN